MTSIQSVVESNLNPSYRGYAAPVVAVLQEREETIKQGLADYAKGRGLSDADVQHIFVSVGLVDPEPEPEPEPEVGSGGLVIEALRAQVERLTEFARGHGFRG